MNPLYAAVRKGTVRVILLVAPPRSVSTGIAIALSQSPDVDLYIHEPFSNDYSNIPSASAGAKLIGEIIKNNNRNRYITPDNPITIVIKEISTHLRPLHFHYLSQYSAAVIIIVRSPLLQLSSIARICKWVWEGSPKKYKFDIRRLSKKDINKYKKNGDIETYFYNSWLYIGNQVQYLDNEWPGNVYNSHNWLGIDTEVVRSNPIDTLKQISMHLGIRFSDKMISGWRKDHLFNIKNDQWSKKTSKSNRLYKNQRTCARIDDIPEQWNQMIEVATSTYANILLNSNFVNPFSSSIEKFHILAEKSLVNVAPDTCYILGGVLSLNNQRKDSFQSFIRRKHPKYSKTFNFLDEIEAIGILQKNNTYRDRDAHH